MEKSKMKIYSIWFLLLVVLPAVPVQAQELEEYLQLAAENNAGLKGAYAEFEATMQQAPQVKSLPDPTLTMSAFGRMIETRLGPQEARFSLMQMFPWFGTLSAREDAAVLMAEAKFQAYLNRRNELFYRVSEQYYRLYDLERRIVYQRQNLEILDDLRELSLSQVRAGAGALSDVLQVDLMRNELQTTLEVLEMERRPLTAAFNALLNRESSEEVLIPQELDAPDTEVVVLREEINREHPALLEMEKMRQSAEAQETVARKSGLPTVGIGVDYVIIGERTDMNPEGNGQDAVMPMLSLSLPIFRKKYRAAREEARLMQESYSQRRDQMENELEAELESAVFEARRQEQMLRLFERQVESSNQILELLLSSYQNDQAAFEEVLRVRQQLLRYQEEMVTARATYFTQLARIKFITGNSY